MIFRFGEIHPDLLSGQLLNELLALPAKQATPKRVAVSMEFKTIYNDAYDELRRELRELLTRAGAAAVPFETTLKLSFAVRAIWAICIGYAFFSATMLTTSNRLALLAIGLGQFVVAPMSLVSCIMRFGTNAPDCALHYICSALAAAFVSAVPGLQFMTVCLDGHFAAMFYLVDFALSMFVYLQISEPFGPVRLLKHIVYGTFNTKTYFLVVFGVLSGFELNLAVMVFTGVLTRRICKSGLFDKMLNALHLPCFPVLFYNEHRINHCPIVYQHAHKLHHYLHDTTAFDAHIYGSGMNEEYCWLLAETVPCLLCPGIFIPYFLNPVTLHSSFLNKGGHTRTSDDGAKKFGDYDEDNFHADHHTLHCANFSSAAGVLLDFYFGTAGVTTKGNCGKRYVFETGAFNEDGKKNSGSCYVVVTDMPVGETNRSEFSHPKQGNSTT